MPTRTIYTDSFMVVIDIGEPPTLSPWLEETTYLIDSSGHTTAMVAQTDQPTAGVALQPVPFTPVNQQALIKTSGTKRTTGLPTVTSPPQITPAATLGAAPTSTNAHSNHSPSTAVLAGVGAAAVVGLIITAVVIWLVRRRKQRNRLYAINHLNDDDAWEDEKPSFQHTFDSWDTLGIAQSARSPERLERKRWGLRPAREVEKDYQIFNSMTDRERAALGYEDGDIWRKDGAESRSSTTLAASPASSLHRESSREARDRTDWDTREVRITQPASILKRLAREGRIQDAAHGEFDGEQGYPNFINATAERAKRGVRWVEEKQIFVVERWLEQKERQEESERANEGRLHAKLGI